ncbi:glycosyltransferase [Stenotrophomonas terrae]|uniref:glycosyltransferase n=1 Tax=Stenotrophomonas terrae TaxID=405446 RepID=UPI00070FB1E7|nr:glycosyltransferase [Stenotrophomonas terrae]
MSDNQINSQGYWDGRFGEDWEVLGGRQQSRFFGAVALNMLPSWLARVSRQRQLAWCDWGCALGDGTNELAQGLPGVQMTGVDFSEVAIVDANARFPGQHFVTENWLDTAAGSTVAGYDVVFSSNTLEHFHQPWAVLDSVAAHARHCLVMMLPYRERERIEEHHASFMPENIPQFVGDKVLVHVQVRDTRADQPCFWPGEQVMLVWAEPNWLAEQQLYLQDVHLDPEPESTLRAQGDTVANLAAELSGGLAKIRSNVAASSEQTAAMDSIRDALSRWRLVFEAANAATGPAWENEARQRSERDAAVLDEALHKLEPLLLGSDLLTALQDAKRRQQLALNEVQQEVRSRQQLVADASQLLSEVENQRSAADIARVDAERAMQVALRLSEQAIALLGPSVGQQLVEHGPAGDSDDARYQRTRLHLASVDKELSDVYASTSWRVTTPIRVLRRLLSHPVQEIRNIVGKAPRPLQGMARFSARTLRSGRLDPSDKAKLKQMLSPSPRIAMADPSLPVDYSHLPMLAPVNGGLPDVYVWAVIDWNFRTQRPQHLAAALAAKGHRVFYISNNFVDSSDAGFKVEALDQSGRLFQVNLNQAGAPQIYHAMPGAKAVAAIRSSLAALLGWARSNSCISFVQHPYWLEPAQFLPNSKLVYDCMDHHGGFEDNADEILAGENQLIRQADLLIVTSQWLHDELSSSARSIAMVRNATEYTHFSERPSKVFADSAGRRVIGYYGAIAEWFDADLLRKLALDNPDALVLMVGRDTAGVAGALSDLSNVRFVGEVAYAELPYWLYGFDVCLLPFKVIPLTLATNPVKVYEYLSAGKPVVSVDLPELSQFEGLVRLAADHEGFLEQVKLALAEPSGDQALELPRKQFASRQTWLHRATTLDNALVALQEPLISIIVLTYNNLDYTKQCLHSLETYSDYENVEIIVVDNASSDGSQEFLADWAANDPRYTFIANESNLGFSAGNNVGLRVAKGEYLVVLNNDTYVTPGWLRTLRNQLSRHPGAGLAGPVTNNIGNEARIEISYDSMDEMLERAGKYTRLHAGRSFDIHTSAFFCVMLTRQAYERVGGLDEQFGVGFFEDDDYCRRLEQAGFSRLCAEDVFVHHHLSASFGKLKAEARQALFEKNKALYEAKWGPWVPHDYRRPPC